MNAFECYRIYVGLKNHFRSPSYDYIKFNGKTNCSLRSFERRNDQAFFQSLSKIYSIKEATDFFVANFVENNALWIGDARTPEAEEVYIQWLKRTDALTYTFKRDIEFLFNEHDIVALKWLNVFAAQNGEYPQIVIHARQHDITLESFIILCEIFDLISVYNREIRERTLWPRLAFKIGKYRPFLKFEKAAFSKIVFDMIGIKTTDLLNTNQRRTW